MLTKAKLSNVDDSGKPGSNSFHVQFNPNEIAISEAVASLYDMEKGTGDPHVNPVETKNDKQVLHLSTTLFYNTFTSLSQKSYEDVRSYIRKLYPYTNVGVETKENLKKICFTWSSICVIGILEKIDVRYTMFSPSGVPVRAEVSISIAGEYYGEQIAEAEPKENGELMEHTSFLESMRSFKESDDWKQIARKQNVKKARL